MSDLINVNLNITKNITVSDDFFILPIGDIIVGDDQEVEQAFDLQYQAAMNESDAPLPVMTLEGERVQTDEILQSENNNVEKTRLETQSLPDPIELNRFSKEDAAAEIRSLQNVAAQTERVENINKNINENSELKNEGTKNYVQMTDFTSVEKNKIDITNASNTEINLRTSEEKIFLSSTKNVEAHMESLISTHKTVTNTNVNTTMHSAITLNEKLVENVNTEGLQTTLRQFNKNAEMPLKVSTAPNAEMPLKVSTAPNAEMPLKVSTAPNAEMPLNVSTAPNAEMPLNVSTAPNAEMLLKVSTVPNSEMLLKVSTVPNSEMPLKVSTVPNSEMPLKVSTAPIEKSIKALNTEVTNQTEVVKQVNPVLNDMPMRTNPILLRDLAASFNLPEAQQSFLTEAEVPASSLNNITPMIVSQATHNLANLAMPKTAMELPLADPNFDQIFSEKVVWMTNQKLQQVQIQLSPAELGPVTAEISMSSGKAHIQFMSDNPMVREAIEQALPRLRADFEGSEVQLNDVNVSAHNTQQQANSEGDTGRDTTHQQNPQNDAVVTSQTVQSLSRGLVDYYA